VEPLVTQGFSVAWFDGPAHGASDGRRVTIPEMATALRAVAETVGPVRGIVAHSGGGMVSAWFVHRRLLDGFIDLPEAIALVAPPADFASYYERFARLSGMTPAAHAQFRRELELRVGVRLETLDLPRLATGLPMAALVVHDREDGEVAWEDGAAVAAAWPDSEFVTTHGLGHRRILRDPSVVARVSAFLATRVGDRPGVTRDLDTVSTLC
jgi:pimeloyl-ACP methyl ester carboxylesterase